MGSTIESNTVVFATGDRIRTDTGEEGRIIIVSFDGKSAFVQLDGCENTTIPIYPVTQLTRLTEVGYCR
jgi:hypothetical protein